MSFNEYYPKCNEELLKIVYIYVGMLGVINVLTFIRYYRKNLSYTYIWLDFDRIKYTSVSSL